LQTRCAGGTFVCPSGLMCAPGPRDSRQFYKKCMGEGNQTLTSTWNGCPPATVACPGRPFVCAPVDGSRTVQQLCEDKAGPFRCPNKQTFCGYRRDANGRLQRSGGAPVPICLASAGRCARPDVLPLPSNFTFGLPNAASFTAQNLRGVLSNGTLSRLVAKFGADRGDAATPLFFTGDGTETSIAVSFSVACC
jgi:hypothetical protein